MLISCLNKSSAIDIAIRFLNQHFSVHEIDAILQDKAWLVTAQIEVFGNTMIESIKINSVTGKIEEYTLKRIT